MTYIVCAGLITGGFYPFQPKKQLSVVGIPIAVTPNGRNGWVCEYVDWPLNFEVSSKTLTFIFDLQVYSYMENTIRGHDERILEESVQLHSNTFKIENWLSGPKAFQKSANWMLLCFFLHLGQCKRYGFIFHWELLIPVRRICILSLEIPTQDWQGA